MRRGRRRSETSRRSPGSGRTSYTSPETCNIQYVINVSSVFLFSFLDLPCSIRRVSYDPLPMSLSTNRADVCFELQQQLKQQTKPGSPFAAVFLCLFPVVHFPPLPFPPQPSFPPPCLSVSESLSQTTLSEAVWGRGRGGSLFGSLCCAATLSLSCRVYSTY